MVEVHPSLFGFHLRITGVTGMVEGTLDADGTVDLTSAVGAEVTMRIDDLDFGNPLLTRSTHGVLDLASDGLVHGRMGEVDRDVDGDGYRFSFEVTSGSLHGELAARCRIETAEDGVAVVHGSTEFRAGDFGVHLPGLDHLHGTCHWTVVAVPDGDRAPRGRDPS